MATGFSQLPNVDWPTEFIDIINDIRRFLMTLQEAHQSGTTETRFKEFVSYRNWLQHRLLSLPSATNATDLGVSARNTSTSQRSSPNIDNLEITRTTLLIISALIIFPTPAASKPNRRLSSQLVALLDPVFADPKLEISESQLRLLMWVVMIGAIHASGINEKAKFTRFAARPLRIYKDHWEVARELLVRFLWDDTLGGLTKVVWCGVCVLGSEVDDDLG